MTNKSEHLRRGLASVEKSRRIEISRMGGKAVRKENRAFSRDNRLAVTAGRKGGQSVPAEKRAFSKSSEFATECGRKGGKSLKPHQRAFAKNKRLASEAGKKGVLARRMGPRKVISAREVDDDIGPKLTEPPPSGTIAEARESPLIIPSVAELSADRDRASKPPCAHS